MIEDKVRCTTERGFKLRSLKVIGWHSQKVFRGVASFLTNCRPGWLSFPHILKIAHMTSTYWPHQHFELLRFLAPLTTHYLLQLVVWPNQKFVSPGIKVYGLATPLVFYTKEFWILPGFSDTSAVSAVRLCNIIWRCVWVGRVWGLTAPLSSL